MTNLVPRGFYVQWALTPQAARESGTFVFRVYRAGGSNGPWEPVSGPLTDQYAFADRLALQPGQTLDDAQRPNQLALARRFFYRVTATTPSGATYEAVDDTDPGLDRLHAMQWRRATYDFNLAMRRQGVPVAIVKRRRWGTRCKKCGDGPTKEIVRAACVTCWGTFFEGGYWAPALVMCRRAPADESTTTAPEQKTDASVTRIWLPDVPQVEKDDLLVFPRDNKRLLVDKQVQTEIGTVTVHQVVTALELNHDSVLYRYRVDLKDVKPLV